MLENKVVTEPDAVEKYFCIPFSQAPVVEMDNDLTELYIHLTNVDPANIKIPEKEKPYLYKIIEKRLPACYTYTITDPRLILFITSLAQTAGKAIMYMVYLQYWCTKHKCLHPNFETIKDIFPNGFPADETLHKLWLDQKIERGGFSSDNLIDYNSAMLSILK